MGIPTNANKQMIGILRIIVFFKEKIQDTSLLIVVMHLSDAVLLASAACHVFWIFNRCASAEIIVSSFNNDTLNRFDDLPAAASFGKSLPYNGLSGHIVYTNPPDACQKLELPPPNASDWIAVISKSVNCGFHDQVLHAEEARFIGAIVYNNESSELIEMTDPLRRRVHIPSTFIGLASSRLLEQYDRRLDVRVKILPPPYQNDEVILIILAGVSSFSAVVILGIVIGIGVHNCCRNRAQLLSRWKLKRLPLHRFKKGDLYENCAICLEEYEEGDKLRILPCAHAFHSKCIDVWLTKNKKTCPLCNETVDPRRRNSRPQSESQSERTPLLSPGTDGDSGEEQGYQSDLSRIRSSVEVHEQPHTSGRTSYGTNRDSSVPASAHLSAPLDLCPEDDTLFAIGREVNVLGQSPLCRIEAEPNRARFLPASETGGLQPVPKVAARNDGRTNSPARSSQQSEVIVSGRKPNRESDNIV